MKTVMDLLPATIHAEIPVENAMAFQYWLHGNADFNDELKTILMRYYYHWLDTQETVSFGEEF